jgi:hypothetical protein
MARPSVLLRSPQWRVPYPCVLCKGGYHERISASTWTQTLEPLLAFPENTNVWANPQSQTRGFSSIVPALAKSARTAHPQLSVGKHCKKRRRATCLGKVRGYRQPRSTATTQVVGHSPAQALEMWGQPPRLSGGPEVSGRNFGACRSLFESSLLPTVGQTPKNCKPVVPTLAKNARMGHPLSW